MAASHPFFSNILSPYGSFTPADAERQKDISFHINQGKMNEIDIETLPSLIVTVVVVLSKYHFYSNKCPSSISFLKS